MKYVAFISYNHKDVDWGKKLLSKLENFRPSASLRKQYGWSRKPLRPIFFAPSDILPGGLTEELKARLKDSEYLIVICSPNSASSQWVGEEIRFFHELGRKEKIILFIVDGDPDSEDPEVCCYHPVLNELGIPRILGANIQERIYRLPWMNRERAFVQLVCKLLGVEFDTIWRRHRRTIIRRVVGWAMAFLLFTGGVTAAWTLNSPVSVSVSFAEVSAPNDSLPPLKDAVVSLELDDEIKADTIRSIDDRVVFRNIPRRFLESDAHITVQCEDYQPADTVLPLSKDIVVGMARDPSVYGDLCFTLWDEYSEETIPDVTVTVGEISVLSSPEGVVCVSIPLERQRVSYPLKASIPLADTLVRATRAKGYVIRTR